MLWFHYVVNTSDESVSRLLCGKNASCKTPKSVLARSLRQMTSVGSNDYRVMLSCAVEDVVFRLLSTVQISKYVSFHFVTFKPAPFCIG